MPTTGYDNSGQIFTETSCRAGPMTSEWEWKTCGSTEEHATYQFPGPSCSSLSAMATRSFLHNSPSLTLSSLEGLPWKLGSVLWAQLRQSHLDSVRVWKCFAATYAATLPLHPRPPLSSSPSSPSSSLRRKLKIIEHPDVPLRLYVEPLISTDGQWLTILTLQNIQCTRSELVYLTRLTNLACLTMGEDVFCDSGLGIDDAVVRGWSDHAAADPKALGVLRVLSLRMHPLVTIKSLRYLRALPVLRVVNVSECGISSEERIEARGLGWRCHSSRNDTGLEKHVTNAERKFIWDEMAERSLAFATSVDGGAASDKAEAEALDQLPRLHLALGRSYVSPGEGRDGFIVGRKKTTFVRSSLPVDEVSEEKLVVQKQKRKLGHGGPHSKLPPRKKSTLRPDKQQDLSSSFLEMVK